ncbi:MAG: glycine zipper domain-containing protein [Pseudomonadota bacterium]
MQRTQRTAVVVFGLVAVTFGQPAAAQTFVYPEHGQSAEQEEKDKLACHDWAMKQTGVNPDQPAQVYNPPDQQRGFGLLRGAGIGAAAGAIGGAIAGKAGMGAAIGAAVGGFLGIVHRREQVSNQYDEQQQEINNHKYALQQYDRAFSTCLRGKGYTVRD